MVWIAIFSTLTILARKYRMVLVRFFGSYRNMVILGIRVTLFLVAMIAFMLITLFSGIELGEIGIGPMNMRIFWWSTGALVLLVPSVMLFARRKKSYDVYPLFRRVNWTFSWLAVDLGSWFIYLLGYEFIFRGLLLFTTLSVLDVYSAIAINIVLYVIVHLPKGFGEALGSIPFGIILCLASIYTGTFITAVIIHCILAFSNDLWTIYFNPDMKWRTGP